LTCHVAARSPGPGKLSFLPFDTHRIKKSDGESEAFYMSNSVMKITDMRTRVVKGLGPPFAVAKPAAYFSAAAAKAAAAKKEKAA